ncbi:MAG TPA: DUF998 domain-containing protein [Actinoplanes sp.]|nr:DUF998 domain-containing protein [Actinoplanes sp.]
MALMAPPGRIRTNAPATGETRLGRCLAFAAAAGIAPVATAIVPTDPIGVAMSGSAYVHRYVSVAAFVSLPGAGALFVRRLRRDPGVAAAAGSLLWRRLGHCGQRWAVAGGEAEPAPGALGPGRSGQPREDRLRWSLACHRQADGDGAGVPADEPQTLVPVVRAH